RAQPAVEGLDVGIVRWGPGPAEGECDAMAMNPVVECAGEKLRAIAHLQDLEQPMRAGNLLQDGHHPRARQGGVALNRRTPPAHGIHYLTDAEWTLLEPLLPPESPVGRLRLHSLRIILNAIVYELLSITRGVASAAERPAAAPGIQRCAPPVPILRTPHTHPVRLHARLRWWELSRRPAPQ